MPFAFGVWRLASQQIACTHHLPHTHTPNIPHISYAPVCPVPNSPYRCVSCFVVCSFLFFRWWVKLTPQRMATRCIKLQHSKVLTVECRALNAECPASNCERRSTRCWRCAFIVMKMFCPISRCTSWAQQHINICVYVQITYEYTKRKKCNTSSQTNATIEHSARIYILYFLYPEREGPPPWKERGVESRALFCQQNAPLSCASIPSPLCMSINIYARMYGHVRKGFYGAFNFFICCNNARIAKMLKWPRRLHRQNLKRE